MEKKKYSLFHIEGGLGKHVAATAVAKTIKNNHPDRELVVVCAYPELFLDLEYVYKVYAHGITPYFYEDYIENADTLIFKHEPYFTTDHIYKKRKLVDSWSRLYGLEYNGEQPDLRFNIRNRQIARMSWVRNKPIMVLHTNGGPIHDQKYQYVWTRDMPINVQHELVMRYSKDYHIIQICRDSSQVLNGVEAITDKIPNMTLFSLLLHSQKQVLIDSCLQHAAAALNKKSTVLWIGTSPTVFGYDIHDNIVADIPDRKKLPDSYLLDYGFNGETHECPYYTDSFFDINLICESIDNGQ